MDYVLYGDISGLHGLFPHPPRGEGRAADLIGFRSIQRGPGEPRNVARRAARVCVLYRRRRTPHLPKPIHSLPLSLSIPRRIRRSTPWPYLTSPTCPLRSAFLSLTEHAALKTGPLARGESPHAETAPALTAGCTPPPARPAARAFPTTETSPHPPLKLRAHAWGPIPATRREASSPSHHYLAACSWSSAAAESARLGPSAWSTPSSTQPRAEPQTHPRDSRTYRVRISGAESRASASGAKQAPPNLQAPSSREP